MMNYSRRKRCDSISSTQSAMTIEPEVSRRRSLRNVPSLSAMIKSTSLRSLDPDQASIVSTHTSTSTSRHNMTRRQSLTRATASSLAKMVNFSSTTTDEQQQQQSKPSRFNKLLKKRSSQERPPSQLPTKGKKDNNHVSSLPSPPTTPLPTATANKRRWSPFRSPRNSTSGQDTPPMPTSPSISTMAATQLHHHSTEENDDGTLLMGERPPQLPPIEQDQQGFMLDLKASDSTRSSNKSISSSTTTANRRRSMPPSAALVTPSSSINRKRHSTGTAFAQQAAAAIPSASVSLARGSSNNKPKCEACLRREARRASSSDTAEVSKNKEEGVACEIKEHKEINKLTTKTTAKNDEDEDEKETVQSHDLDSKHQQQEVAFQETNAHEEHANHEMDEDEQDDKEMDAVEINKDDNETIISSLSSKQETEYTTAGGDALVEEQDKLQDVVVAHVGSNDDDLMVEDMQNNLGPAESHAQEEQVSNTKEHQAVVSMQQQQQQQDIVTTPVDPPSPPSLNDNDSIDALVVEELSISHPTALHFISDEQQDNSSSHDQVDIQPSPPPTSTHSDSTIASEENPTTTTTQHQDVQQQQPIVSMATSSSSSLAIMQPIASRAALVPSTAEQSLVRLIASCMAHADKLEALANEVSRSEYRVSQLLQQHQALIQSLDAREHRYMMHVQTYQQLLASQTRMLNELEQLQGRLSSAPLSCWHPPSPWWATLAPHNGGSIITQQKNNLGHTTDIVVAGTCVAHNPPQHLMLTNDAHQSTIYHHYLLHIGHDERSVKFVLCPPDQWVPDEHADACQEAHCDTHFNLFNRRHHCRSCGHIVCNKHSQNRLPLFEPLNRDKGEWARVCDACFYRLLDRNTSSLTTPS
ncbi:predicted protein [Lichtheimia corymbifera JMRC:FSU:9682]|uniref:FYVE-type domain-containing protein n=1 Tax=Lichtheimia corymbifera JMRC:FSU:9682 TaxID=1263082 RepID=A0A068RZM0_9FUNG|nr:predicted protein [Lichtheimia corymbifera JMRC:FSU:9682]